MFRRIDEASQRVIGLPRGIPRVATSVFIASVVVVCMVVMFEGPAAMSWQVGPKAQQGKTNAKRARKKAARGGEGGKGKIKRPEKPPTSVMPGAESAGLGMGPGGVPLRSYEFETVNLDSSGMVGGRSKGQARYFVEDLGGGVTLEMVEIPAGSFIMGSPDTEQNRSSDEGPQHLVTVGEFYMGKFEVTQRQWRAVALMPKVGRDLNTEPSQFRGDDLPVEQVSWDDAMEFCARLTRATRRSYRLPSEAEWEYACRAGTTTPFGLGDTVRSDLVNYNGDHPYGSVSMGTYRQKTAPVGSLGEGVNGFGLYDMHGNVSEWCLDAFHNNYMGAPSDGSEWEGGDTAARVLRGGSWVDYAGDCRSADRVRGLPDIRGFSVGFRVVLAGGT
jgi:eukaryotic-like serine/threonine-protein kinase